MQQKCPWVKIEMVQKSIKQNNHSGISHEAVIMSNIFSRKFSKLIVNQKKYFHEKSGNVKSPQSTYPHPTYSLPILCPVQLTLVIIVALAFGAACLQCSSPPPSCAICEERTKASTGVSVVDDCLNAGFYWRVDHYYGTIV